MDPFIIGLRFQKIGKLYHFDASAYRDLRLGDFVVVETSRGRQLGEVIQTYDAPPQPPPDGSWKTVERMATPRDLVLRQVWGKKELEATINCRARLSEMGIQGIKIVASEFSFDGSRLAFLYATESGDRQELNQVRNAMQRIYTRTRVEMRQIGPRDVAKILGGMGACGLETRCCSMFLTEFSPVSIKMAKEQGISLTPSEITGMCGRLRCCLVYEYEQYIEARKMLPKRGKRVVSPLGEGKVTDTYPLRQSVLVDLGDGSRHEFMKHELQPWDELEALRRKSEAPCDRHENGGCDCGKSGAPGFEAKAAPAAGKVIEVDAETQEAVEKELDDLVGLAPEDEVDGPEAHTHAESPRDTEPTRPSQERQVSQPRPTNDQDSGQGGKKRRQRRPFRRKRSGGGKSGGGKSTGEDHGGA